MCAARTCSSKIAGGTGGAPSGRSPRQHRPDLNDVSGFVYDEEFALADAFAGPDGQRLAFWQFDQHGVRYAGQLHRRLYPVLFKYHVEGGRRSGRRAVLVYGGHAG
jgi:hypothetical protein